MKAGKLPLLVSATLGTLVFIVYVLTLYPSVGGGDSGEFATLACASGIAHPPGYPLYLLLLRGFSHLVALGSFAWRANLFSAVADAFASSFLLLAVAEWTGSLWAGILSGGLLAFSPLTWAYATQAEVFALNNCLLALECLLFIRYNRERRCSLAYLGALVAGLAASNHQVSGLITLPWAGWLIYRDRKCLARPRSLVGLAGAFLLGLTPYLVLLISGAGPSSWGNPTTVSGFLTHVLRREYGTWQLAVAQPHASVLRGMFAYFRALPGELSFIGISLAALGLFARLRREGLRDFAFASLLAFGAFTLVFHALANLPLEDPLYFGIQSRFWQIPSLLVCAWAGAGLTTLCARFKWIGAVISIATLALALGLRFPRMDHHRDFAFLNYGQALLDPLPPHAIFLPLGDLDTNVSRYLQTCERIRPDVAILPRSLLGYPWMKPKVEAAFPEIQWPKPGYYRFYVDRPDGFSLQDFLRANLPHAPIFLSNRNPRESRDWERDFYALPWGLVDQIVSKQSPPSIQDYLAKSEARSQALSSLANLGGDPWEDYARERYWDSEYRRSLLLTGYRGAPEGARMAAQAACRILERWESAHSPPLVGFYKDLGFAYARLREFEPLAAPKMIAAWRKYLESAPVSDPERPEIERELASEKTH